MLGLRLPELLIILAVLLLMFGAKKLPELGDSIGKGIRAFKKATEHGLVGDDPEAASTPQPTLEATAAKAPAPPAPQKQAAPAGKPAAGE